MFLFSVFPQILTEVCSLQLLLPLLRLQDRFNSTSDPPCDYAVDTEMVDRYLLLGGR